MRIYPCCNYNNSFGSTVFITPSANEIISSYKPTEKKLLKQRLAELENNDDKNAVVIDSCNRVQDIKMTVYSVINGKLYQGEYPTRFPLDKGFSCYYKREADMSHQVPVKKTQFDRYNHLLVNIKEACEAE